MRQRLRGVLPPAATEAEVVELTHALEEADPLASITETSPPRRSWITALRELLTSWPGRLALAGGAGVVLLLGLALGRVTVSTQVAKIAFTPPPKPAYQAESGRPLGLIPTVKPESERKFREAMALHASAN